MIYADKIQNECQIVLVGLETRDDVMNTLSINAELVTDSDTDVCFDVLAVNRFTEALTHNVKLHTYSYKRF